MPVSIVVVFHNEYIGVILRSLYSIAINTPRELINEIILVDDGSTENYVGSELESYIEKTRGLIQNIHLLRLKERLGANRAILKALPLSTADHLVLMTRVVDVGRNWLPPLLNSILKNSHTVTVPVHEFKHWKPNTTVVWNGRGLFDLELKYIEMAKLKEVAESTNFRSPILPPKGIFVINKAFLLKLSPDAVGGQDGNLIELSLKIWTCGGRILKIPCSRVYHSYKESGLHDAYVHDAKQLNLELKSTIETWFDEYSKIFLNISSRFQETTSSTTTSDLRGTCQSFKWFLNKVAPDLKAKYLTAPKTLRSGKFLNIKENLCLKQKQDVNEFLSLEDCNNATDFELTRMSDIRLENTFLCWEAYKQVRWYSFSFVNFFSPFFHLI